MVSLDLFLPVRVDTYKRSFACHSTVVVKLAEGPSESVELAASFETDATKKGGFPRYMH